MFRCGSIRAKRIGFVFLFLALILEPLSAQQKNERDIHEREFAANKILARSLVSAEEQNYSKAVQDLILILDYYPEFSQIDTVIYVLGNNLTEMGLYSSADQIYRYLIKSNLKSPLVPFALYGLERLYYRQAKYDRAIDYFRLLREKFPQAKVGDGIYYYAGQSMFFQNDFDNAIQTLNAVEEGSEFWGYALYTRALAHFKKKMLPMPLPI